MRQTAASQQIAERYARVRESLNERARRLFVATEALTHGYGGISLVSRVTGVARRTIGAGILELRQIEDGWTPPWGHARMRKPGAGRKKTTAKDPTLLPDLQALVEATTRGRSRVAAVVDGPQPTPSRRRVGRTRASDELCPGRYARRRFARVFVLAQPWRGGRCSASFSLFIHKQ